jgi:hypothetical protein
MDDALRAQRDFALRQLDDLNRRGRRLSDALAANPDDAPSLAAARAWQQASAAAIHQLSGGSKAHWLSRAFSGALLVRSAEGGAIVEATVREIVDRILDVLAQGATSLSRMDDVETASSGAAPRPRRFEFVHNAELRPVLEQSFDDSRAALERGQFGLSLILSCGVIEAIITDALQYCGSRIAECGSDSSNQSAVSDPQSESAIRNPQSAMTGLVAEWSFESRIAEAERVGLIRGGCARLPPIARRYRAVGESAPAVSEREARLAGQVLHVVMRDLDPGR